MHMDKDDHPVMTPGMEREEAGSPGGYPLGEPLEAPGGLPGQTPPASQPDARLPFLRLTPSAFRFPLGEGWDFRFHLRKTTSRRSQSEGPAGAIPSANGRSLCCRISTTSGVRPLLSSSKGKGKRALGAFINARVCTPAMLHTIPCCDFTMGLVPTRANCTLLAPLIWDTDGPDVFVAQ
nr:uncharacterized protein LOC123283962 isoform X2 [Equus asinus]